MVHGDVQHSLAWHMQHRQPTCNVEGQVCCFAVREYTAGRHPQQISHHVSGLEARKHRLQGQAACLLCINSTFSRALVPEHCEEESAGRDVTGQD